MANTHLSTQTMRFNCNNFIFLHHESQRISTVASPGNRWQLPYGEGDAHVLIYIERDLCVGKLVWVMDGNGSSKSDTIVLSGFTYDSDTREWTGGTVYDPRHGHKASGHLALKDSRTLRVVGHKAFRWISDTELWTRIDTYTK